MTLDSERFSPLISTPTPFLRWAGGKRKLANLIVSSFPGSFDSKRNRYFEPFLGGGAIAFATGSKDNWPYISGSRLVLADMNPDLIATYEVVRDDVHGLMKTLDRLGKNVSKEEFERIRKSRPTTQLSVAARFIYLNKTCFNGLWRVNKKGEFNVPWGKLKNPMLYDREQLIKSSQRLIGAKIYNQDFTKTVRSARSGDLVYFDPPYIPLDATSSFSSYSKEDFGLLEHKLLAKTISNLTDIGVKVILSNSDTVLTREVFGQTLDLHQIQVRRSISAASSSRKNVNEIIGVNFDLPRNSLLH